jgi:hypothetical protein
MNSHLRGRDAEYGLRAPFISAVMSIDGGSPRRAVASGEFVTIPPPAAPTCAPMIGKLKAKRCLTVNGALMLPIIKLHVMTRGHNRGTRTGLRCQVTS